MPKGDEMTDNAINAPPSAVAADEENQGGPVRVTWDSMVAKGTIVVGILYLLGSVALFLSAIALARLQHVTVGQAIAKTGFAPTRQYVRIVILFSAGVSAVFFGVAFQRRKRWSRRALQYLAGIMAAAYLIGALTSAYVVLFQQYHRLPAWFYAGSAIAGLGWGVGLGLFANFLKQTKVKAHVGESTQATA